MAKFSQFLLVSDFDHTLTDHTGQIPQANLDAIEYFMENGGVFTICTGRSLPASRYRFESIPMNAPLLFCNGAGCYDLKEEKLIFCHPLPEDSISFMQHCEKAYCDLRLEVHGLDKHYVFHPDEYRDAALRRQRTDFVHATWDTVPEPRVKFSLYNWNASTADIDPQSEHGQYFQRVTEEINSLGAGRYIATNSMPGLVEVQVAGTSKGLAARQLAKTLGREILVCAGDAPNDITMLQEADRPFYVSDGDPRMLQYGFPQAAPSHEGAIADIIRQLEETV